MYFSTDEHRYAEHLKMRGPVNEKKWGMRGLSKSGIYGGVRRSGGLGPDTKKEEEVEEELKMRAAADAHA